MASKAVKAINRAYRSRYPQRPGHLICWDEKRARIEFEKAGGKGRRK